MEKVVKSFYLYIFCIIFFSCTFFEKKYYVYSISSPKGDKCIYMLISVEYRLFRQTQRLVYIIDHKPNYTWTFLLPDNGVAMEEIDQEFISGMFVNWETQPIKIRDCCVNKNNLDSTVIDLKYHFNEEENKERKNGLWKKYYFIDIINGEYKSCE